jgi:hypothetical protein
MFFMLIPLSCLSMLPLFAHLMKQSSKEKAPSGAFSQ